MADVTTINVSCLCGDFRTSISMPRSSLPLVGVLCHCKSCRHVLGTLCASYGLLPFTPGPLTGLSKYDSSEDGTRWFCGGCGAHVFAHLKAKDLWLLATGVLKTDGNIIRFRAHYWVGDTLDGGLSAWLPKLYGKDMLQYQKGSKSGDLFESNPTLTSAAKPTNQEATQPLRASCQCRGVQFHITPPNENSKNPTSPWSDLLTPYHSTSPANPTDVKWWLRPTASGTKYFAGLCTCASCRQASGSDVQAWAFVPKANILQDDGKPLDFTTAMGTLRRYVSSKGTYREFCATCGATVFWHDDERPDVVDVAVGLLEAESGARAEEWLDWCRERVSFMEHARDGVFVGALMEGLRGWAGEGKS